jgi:3-oxoacyl-[acyl-carrier-protein] synthase II
LKRRVVVTGVGLVTPLGNDRRSTWEAIVAGRSGADAIAHFDASGLPVRIAAEVKGFDPVAHLSASEVRRTGAFTHYAASAADEALSDACFRVNPTTATRTGVFISSGIGGFDLIEREHGRLLEGGPDRISPFFIPGYMPNMAAGLVSIRHGLKGPNSATATACAAGNHAIGESLRIIQRGDADAMLCGGAEGAVTPMCISGFAAMRALSKRNDAPELASRPFDRDRDGFVVGEGAGILLLESLDSALGRDARIYAEVVGYALTADAYHITKPDESQRGVIAAMRLAIRDAGLAPNDVDYVNAHGTSTPLGDVAETHAIKHVFGEHARHLMVSSTKSMTGHALGAAGGIEAGLTVLALDSGVVPPTINLSTADPECDLDYVANVARTLTINAALSNGFGFGGTNATLAFARWPMASSVTRRKS